MTKNLNRKLTWLGLVIAVVGTIATIYYGEFNTIPQEEKTIVEDKKTQIGIGNVQGTGNNVKTNIMK